MIVCKPIMKNSNIKVCDTKCYVCNDGDKEIKTLWKNNSEGGDFKSNTPCQSACQICEVCLEQLT